MAMRRSWLLVLGLMAIGAALTLMACQPRTGADDVGDKPITVAAASDLQYAFKEIGKLFQQETGRKVIFNFGSSGTLAKQIENGAPIDVFAAANVQFVDDLRAKGMVKSDTQQLYALGRIVLARNKRSGPVVRNLNDLVRPDVKKIAIANPEHAPYGAAAKQALEAAGVWDRVKAKLVYGENISQTMQFVQTGNVEAGIIALSIANVPEIDYTPIDDRLHKPLTQAIAVVSGTKQETVSREFVAFVNGPKGRPVMQKYGFVLPGEF